MVDCLRLCFPVQGVWVHVLVREVRPHMLCGVAKIKKKKKIVLLVFPDG